MGKHKIDSMVQRYRDTKDKMLLDKIAKETQGLIYNFGKSFKQIPTCELNALFGIALMKALKSWKVDGQAKFTTYLSTVIMNELRMHIRGKQQDFEGCILQQVSYFNEIVGDDDITSEIEHTVLVNDIIEEFESEATKQALRMYYEGYLIEYIVKHLNIGRTSFYADLKTFKKRIREGLQDDYEF